MKTKKVDFTKSYFPFGKKKTHGLAHPLIEKWAEKDGILYGTDRLSLIRIDSTLAKVDEIHTNPDLNEQLIDAYHVNATAPSILEAMELIPSSGLEIILPFPSRIKYKLFYIYTDDEWTDENGGSCLITSKPNAKYNNLMISGLVLKTLAAMREADPDSKVYAIRPKSDPPTFHRGAHDTEPVIITIDSAYMDFVAVFHI